MKRNLNIGMVINSSSKPSRDFMLSLEAAILARNASSPSLTPKFFLGSIATTPENLGRFVASGVDVLVFCGLRHGNLFSYLASAPNHPPIVLCSHSDVPEEDFARLGRCAVVMRDNAATGRTAADFFLRRGLHNFAFLARNGLHEHFTGAIREQAFHKRLEEVAGGGFWYSSFKIGSCAENEDYWEATIDDVRSWLSSLQLPCGLFVNSDHLAFRVTEFCLRNGVPVPGKLEILCLSNNNGFNESSIPAISSIVHSSDAMAEKALDLAIELAVHPSAGRDHRVEVVDSLILQERGTTSIGRGYGQVAVRAREFIRLNVSRGIKVADVAKALGVSIRTLEFRVKEAAGMSVRDLIINARMEKVCELLATTNLPITRIVEDAGCPISSNIFALFKRRYGVPMTEYRRQSRNG